MTHHFDYEELKQRLTTLEKEIAGHELTDQKISALSILCSLLGTDHHGNIDVIVGQAREILSGACAFFHRFDAEDKSIFASFAGEAYEGLDAQKLVAMLDRNLTKSDQLDSQKPFVIIEDLISRHHDHESVYATTFGLASCIGIGVVLENKVIGSLSLFDTQPKRYSATDKRVISTLAKAIAIEEERIAAEKTIQESEERYRTILEDIEEGYYEVDLQGNFTFLGGAFCKIFGYTEAEIIGRKYAEFSSPKTAERAYEVYHTVFSTEAPANDVPWEVAGKDGTLKRLESSISLIKSRKGVPIGFRGIVRDITERRRLESQLRQAQKMEAIGTMAGGIAHDFNNILSIIIGNTELALCSQGQLRPTEDSLKEILVAALRARDVIAQMQTFSRKQEVEREVVRITPVVEEAFKLLRASIPKNIEIRMDIKCLRDTVRADTTQIHQVLINLCTNAAHAMQDDGGLLEVNLANVMLKAFQHSGLPPGLYVSLQVSDTGTGIAPDDIRRIFDPYFSTKEVGKGSGMGLSIVHGIVHSHDGDITVSSEKGKGTTFTVLLPVSESRPAAALENTQAIIAGSERILFVDDEVSLAHSTKKNLERLGYRVTVATRPDEALSVFKRDPEQFDLVITDMLMPEMLGDKLAAALMKIRSGLPVVLCTGHCCTITEFQAKQIGIKALVIKPVISEKLALTIRNIFDSAPG